MVAPWLLWIALVGAVAPPDPAALVAKLGSDRFDEREEAAAALRALGDDALPALRAAHDSPDAEVRARATALRAEVERERILRPTPIRLDIEDRPLAEAVAAIEAQSGVRLVPGLEPSPYPRPAPPPGWPHRRVTLREPTPIPFWEAVDRLCRAGDLRRHFSTAMFSAEAALGRLTLGPGRSEPPASGAGPFRVELTRLRHDRDLDLALDPDPQFQRGRRSGATRADAADADRAFTEGFAAHLVVTPEPRLVIVGYGEFERLEAVDDQGRSLLLPPDPDRQRMLAANPELRIRSGMTYQSQIPLSIPLAYPERPGRTLARLRGVLPLAVGARLPDPLDIPLADAAGKTFAKGDTRVTVDAIKRGRGSQGSIDLTIAPDEGPNGEVQVPGADGRPVTIRPLNMIQTRIELLDASGKVLGLAGISGRAGGRRDQLSVNLPWSQGPTPVPARLRYYDLAWAVTAVPFEFRDVPMP